MTARIPPPVSNAIALAAPPVASASSCPEASARRITTSSRAADASQRPSNDIASPLIAPVCLARTVPPAGSTRPAMTG